MTPDTDHSHNHLEIEVKFYLHHPEAVKQNLCNLGAVSMGKGFETNIRFEDENETLIQRKRLLRLRKDNKATLTFKAEPQKNEGQPGEEYKVYRELEVEVSDFSTMESILVRLGFHQAQVYEKERETFLYKQAAICLDTLPYGEFMEIEGEKNRIREIAAALGFDWESRICSNYLEIFTRLQSRLNLEFCDLTFSNFKGVSFDKPTFFSRFQASWAKNR